jgi:type VI protein secretion system component Hcp
MKSYRLYLLVPILLIAPLLANGAAYLKFDGVDGESTDKGHKGWIDLSSVSIRSSDHKSWSDLPSFSQALTPDKGGNGLATGRRDAASGLATGKRDAASGLPTGRRDAASGLPTGKRDAASGLPTGKRDATSGMATGKRQHKPIRISKPIDKSSPMLARALETGNSIGNVTIQRVEDGKTETLNLINVTVASISNARNTEEVTLNYTKINRGQKSNVEVRGWNPKDKAQVRAKEKANRTK